MEKLELLNSLEYNFLNLVIKFLGKRAFVIATHMFEIFFCIQDSRNFLILALNFQRRIMHFKTRSIT